MLYDPKWSEAKTRVPSLDDFIAWLESKDPEARYNFYCMKGECLVGQYMADIGIPWTYRVYSETTAKIYEGTPGGVASRAPWTFGAALLRARAARSSL